MNYSTRNLTIWRWSLITFVTSLVFSLVLAWFEPWDWTLPSRAIWLIPSMIPNWLIWPITNTLFLITFVWIKTNRITCHYFWQKNRFSVYLLALLQALIVSAFCEGYSLVALLTAATLSWAFVSKQFEKEYEALKEYYAERQGVAPSNFKEYDIGFFLVFFCAVVAVYGLNQNWSDTSVQNYAIIFIGKPLLSLIAYIIAVIALILLALFTELLLKLLWKLLRIIGVGLFYICSGVLVALLWIDDFPTETWPNIKKYFLTWKSWVFPTNENI